MGAADDTCADEKAIIDLTVAYAWALGTLAVGYFLLRRRDA